MIKTATIQLLVGAVVTSVALIAGGALTAFAADISVPIDTVITGGVAAGDRVELSVTSSGPFDGASCTVQAVRSGDGAARAGNDLVVTSGTSVVTVVDVEREPAAVTDASGSLTLGELITVELTMGPAGSFDGDVSLDFTCASGGANASGLAAAGASGVANASGLAAAGAAGADADPSSLPVTGAATTLEALLGAALVAVGGLLLWSTRRPATEEMRR